MDIESEDLQIDVNNNKLLKRKKCRHSKLHVNLAKVKRVLNSGKEFSCDVRFEVNYWSFYRYVLLKHILLRRL